MNDYKEYIIKFEKDGETLDYVGMLKNERDLFEMRMRAMRFTLMGWEIKEEGYETRYTLQSVPRS